VKFVQRTFVSGMRSSSALSLLCAVLSLLKKSCRRPLN